MRIIIAGGGTGGHLFPALAIAEAFRRRNAGNQILFVGAKRGLESRIVSQEGYGLKTIEVASWKGKGLGGKMVSLMSLPKSLAQSWAYIRAFQPQLVLGVGGYASGPVVLTAWAMGRKTAIQEQNSYPGLSNRILGRFVDRVFLSFETSGRYFPQAKIVVTGNPVREKIRTRGPSPSPRGGKGFTLLVFGGSQGAHRLNRAMAEALGHLGDLKRELRIIHQTGERDYEQAREFYAREGVEAEVHPFISDMERAYGEADLVVCRAGATTLFELMVMGKPSLLVPYPHAANDHQRLNAQILVDAGAAKMVPDAELNGWSLGRALRHLAADREHLRRMGERAATLARPDAAEKIVEICYRMVGE